jgi:hypothetical protein
LWRVTFANASAAFSSGDPWRDQLRSAFPRSESILVDCGFSVKRFHQEFFSMYRRDTEEPSTAFAARPSFSTMSEIRAAAAFPASFRSVTRGGSGSELRLSTAYPQLR